jgi:hypothetical protein
MLSKKLNDPFYWKNKLEALNCLPGEAAHEKDALWEKLYGRLQQKPVAGKARWYWIAAGLLPLIIIAITMINNTGNILVNPETVKDKNTKATPSYLQPASTEAVTLSISAPAEKIQPATGIKPKEKSKIFNDTIKANDAVVSILPEKTETDIATNNMLPPDTAVAVETTTIVKKKLQVVHINELETYPVQFAGPVNYTQNIKSRKNKTNNQGVATQQNTIGFKIKLSSKN